MMIGHAEAKGTDAGMLEHSAEADLPIPLAVPLREYDDSSSAARVKKTRVGVIVLRVRRFYIAGILQ